MRFGELFDRWGLRGIKLSAGFAELEFQPQTADRDAAWAMYVELLTRITTQHLQPEDGDEQTALTSVFSLFGLTREILKSHGRGCQGFAKVAIVVLNQIIRPFTAKWHKLSLGGAFDNAESCQTFREELSELQEKLRGYTRLLADMAQVEDLTVLEPNGES